VRHLQAAAGIAESWTDVPQRWIGKLAVGVIPQAKPPRCQHRSLLAGAFAGIAAAGAGAAVAAAAPFRRRRHRAPNGPWSSGWSRQRVRCIAATATEPAATAAAGTAPVVDAELAGPGDADEGPGTDGSTDAWKRELLRLCAAGNRGLGASKDEKARVLELVERLESSYRPPLEEGKRRSLLEGSWAVIFTTSPDLTTLDRLPLPGWRTGRIGQVFAQGGDAANEIDFASPFGSRVSQVVKCQWADKGTSNDQYRVQLTFVGSSTKLSEVAGIELPALPVSLPLPPAAGVFQVSYLDEELMVQRTRASSAGVNVLTREDHVENMP